MICDGRSLDGNDPTFKPLFDAIRFAWDGDPNENFFHIPYLRGAFLRGVDPQRGTERGTLKVTGGNPLCLFWVYRSQATTADM
jgi:hypothetical protein